MRVILLAAFFFKMTSAFGVFVFIVLVFFFFCIRSDMSRVLQMAARCNYMPLKINWKTPTEMHHAK